MKQKPTQYLPFYAKRGAGFEKHETRCVAFTPRQIESLNKGLAVTTERIPYVVLNENGSHSSPVHNYTYGAVCKDQVLQGVYLISKGAHLYAVK